MSREDTIICMDNSEWMRNGDYSRTRMEAQYQAIEHLVRAKTANPENTVGLISLAGGLGVGVQVLCSPTTERFKVGKAAQHAEIGGKPDILNGLKVAQLALKFRPHRQIQARIIVFVGSPLDSIDQGTLISLGKKLKKNNIAVDVIAVGEHEVNVDILTNFVKSVEKPGSAPSTLVIVPAGGYIEDSIRESAMGQGEMEEELDPMLAMALAESRAMAQAQLAGTEGAAPAQAAPTSAKPALKFDNTSTTATEGESVPQMMAMDDEDDEEAILEQAKLMSLLEQNQTLDESARSDGKPGVGSALSKDFAKNLMKSAGVDVTNKEVEEELKELQKSDKKGKDKEKDGDKKGN